MVRVHLVSQTLTNKTVTAMNKISNVGPMSEAVKEAPLQISSYRYNTAIQHMILLRSMGELDNKEVKRLISMLKSPDYENWIVAETCIEKLLA